MKDGFPVSVAELLAAGLRPLPSEAVAIVLDVCRQVMGKASGPSVLPPISAAALFLDPSGSVAVAGGVPAEDEQTVPLLGRVLLQMLQVPPSGTTGLVPARLRRLAMRAAAGDSPGLTVGRLAAALRPFGPEQPALAIRALFHRWHGDGEPRISTYHEGVMARESSPPPSGSQSAVGEQPAVQLEGDRGDHHPGRRRARVALVVVLFLVLLGAGATYWLNADQALPPLPVNPAILLKEPPPPRRDVWELLPDPAGLAVKAGVEAPLPGDRRPRTGTQATARPAAEGEQKHGAGPSNHSPRPN